MNRQILDDFITWARDLSDAFVKVVAVPDEVNFALDPNWCTLYPYQSKVAAGERLLLEPPRHQPRPQRRDPARQPGPARWLDRHPSRVRGPDLRRAERRGDLRRDRATADATGRHVLCADVTLGERRFGWVTEAIVDVTPA